MKERWKQLNWKQKERLLVLIVLLSACLIYQLAVQRTVELAENCEEIRMKIDSAELVNIEIRELENELKQYETTRMNRTYVTHEKLLDVIDSFCSVHGLTIRDFPPVRQYNKEEWRTEIHEVTVSGKYVDAVLLLEYLFQYKQGQIVSVTFFSVTDKKTKEKHLFTKIYIQNISKAVT